MRTSLSEQPAVFCGQDFYPHKKVVKSLNIGGLKNKTKQRLKAKKKKKKKTLENKINSNKNSTIKNWGKEMNSISLQKTSTW